MIKKSPRGRKPCLNDMQLQTLALQLQTRKTIIDIAKDLKVSRFSIYNYIKKFHIPYKEVQQQQQEIQ